MKHRTHRTLTFVCILSLALTAAPSAFASETTGAAENTPEVLVDAAGLPVAPLEQALGGGEVGDACPDTFFRAFIDLGAECTEQNCADACADAGGDLWAWEFNRACLCYCCPE